MALEKREKKYFGTNGVRGVTGVDMTPVFALKVAEAFGTMLGEGKKIGIGRDTRTSGPALASAVRAGLMACGCNVVDFDIIPTPGLQDPCSAPRSRRRGHDHRITQPPRV